KKKRKKSQARNIDAHWLTSAEDVQEWEAQDEVREERKQRKAELAAWKAAKQADRGAQQALQGNNIQFSSALSQKSKDVLIDIAHCLTIETMGTKAELLKAIQNHFNAHQHLKADAHFEGLFNT
ncbi:hypothetical protein M404DRAFT_77289, partial [Pisolithus tinctorius Marx 270]